jgi:hypothetical protein
MSVLEPLDRNADELEELKNDYVFGGVMGNLDKSVERCDF